MAQQTGIVGLRGTVGGLVFAKDGSVRQQPASNKAAFDSKASMARVRENASEFGWYARFAGAVANSVRPLNWAFDSRVQSRLQKHLMKMKAVAGTYGLLRGQRGPLQSLLASGLGISGKLQFEMNAAAPFSRLYPGTYSAVPNFFQRRVTVTLDAAAGRLPMVPPGATHYEVFAVAGAAAMGRMDVVGYYAPYELGAFRFGEKQSFGLREVTDALSAATVDVYFTWTLPGNRFEVVTGLAVRFYQQVNGTNYEIGGGQYSAGVLFNPY